MGRGVAGGMGAGGLLLALVGYVVFGIPPEQTLSTVSAIRAPSQPGGVEGAPSDEAGRFVDVIATSVDDMWTQILREHGARYVPPRVVLYDRATGTGCGMGQAAMGPFYCPSDQRVYLDLTFWDELAQRFGAQGEAARAYVIAHEIAHYVQHLTGQTDRAARMSAQGADSGSVRLELQADCYAGVWAARVAQVSGGAVALDPSDVEDGLRAASAIGDDTLQERTRGRVMPDAFTHGTSAQRVRWLRIGIESGDPARCDTFEAARL